MVDMIVDGVHLPVLPADRHAALLRFGWNVPRGLDGERHALPLDAV